MNAKQELEFFNRSTESLNEARIAVVEFLDGIEVEKKLSIVSATKTLQRALTMYERSIRFIMGATISSVLSDYYSDVSDAATTEKEYVTEMFKAVLRQDVKAFDTHYQAYVQSLSK